MRLIDADALKKAIIKHLCVKSENNLLPAERTIYNLIDEQPTIEQPKVLSKEDVAKHDVVWMETYKDEIFPVLVNGATGHPKSKIHYYIHLYGVDGYILGFPAFLYNRTWRCWTARPTNNVRMNTPWEGRSIKPDCPYVTNGKCIGENACDLEERCVFKKGGEQE